MKLARRAGSTSARRALVEPARRASFIVKTGYKIETRNTLSAGAWNWRCIARAAVINMPVRVPRRCAFNGCETVRIWTQINWLCCGVNGSNQALNCRLNASTQSRNWPSMPRETLRHQTRVCLCVSTYKPVLQSLIFCRRFEWQRRHNRHDKASTVLGLRRRTHAEMSGVLWRFLHFHVCCVTFYAHGAEVRANYALFKIFNSPQMVPEEKK